MVVRSAIGAGLPLAGTGCAIARATLARLADERGGAPFDAASLVEDYELGLAIAERGGRVTFARCRDAAGGLVAVHAEFPRDFIPAARQKARWMAGIALAGWDRVGWSTPMALADHWMRLRDRRWPLAVLVTAAAYAAFLAWPLAQVFHMARGEPTPPVAPYRLMLVNALLLLWRLAVRAGFTARRYGWRQGMLAVPRLVVGNFVALTAAPRALATYWPTLAGRLPVWDKTEHQLPEGVADPVAG